MHMLISDENFDLTMALMRDGIYEMLLESVESNSYMHKFLKGLNFPGKSMGVKNEYLDFYKNQSKRMELFELGERFDESVKMKFKLMYLKDYVYALETNEKITNKLNYVRTLSENFYMEISLF